MAYLSPSSKVLLIVRNIALQHVSEWRALVVGPRECKRFIQTNILGSFRILIDIKIQW